MIGRPKATASTPLTDKQMEGVTHEAGQVTYDLAGHRRLGKPSTVAKAAGVTCTAVIKWRRLPRYMARLDQLTPDPMPMNWLKAFSL